MGIKAALAVAAVSFVATALMASPSQAQSGPTVTAETDPNEPAGFEIAYGMSFMKYDACDDHVAGHIFRQAVLERFKRCRFSKEVNDKFQNWLIENLEALATDGWRAAAERLDVTQRPDFFPEGIKSCEEYRAMPDYVEKRTLLLKYKHREVDLDAVMGDECSLGPAAL